MPVGTDSNKDGACKEGDELGVSTSCTLECDQAHELDGPELKFECSPTGKLIRPTGKCEGTLRSRGPG